jgi:hypothetical protein
VSTPPLAAVDDVAALGADPASITPEMIAAASARFRAEARHAITPTTHRAVLAAYAGTVTLPTVPVTGVTLVARVGTTGQPGEPLTGWTFDGTDEVSLRQATVPGYLTRGIPRSLWVEWQAGHDPIPEDVRWTVAHMVKRAAEAGPSGVTSEQIGDYSRSFGSCTASGAMSMTDDEQAIAHRYRPRRTTVTVVDVW